MGGKRVILKAGKEKSILQRHPWIFSGAVASVAGDPQIGETVEVCNDRGERLGWAAYSPHSSIRARVWSFNPNEVINPEFFMRKIQAALRLREVLNLNEQTNAYRLIHGEADGMPGMIVDLYPETAVVQILSAGAEYWRDVIVDQIQQITGCKAVVERSDVEVRQLEGLPFREGVIRGRDVPQRLKIIENGIQYWVDVMGGQKTGFYLDQRQNRKRLTDLARDREVLNAFCYTGGFTLSALAGGAKSVLSIDSSAAALHLAEENLKLNGFDPTKNEWLEANVFEELRRLRDRNKKFDLIVLDPPKFAPTSAQAQKAARAYKDINLLGFKLLRSGGILVTFSCSGGVSRDLFQKIVADAALDAGVNAKIIEVLSQSGDHPVALNFPESAYLKGFICVAE
ncbi:predicted SAM-dependent methyltransferases [Bellilinea caldifistulae]|uniref:23S rRNA methyltransferase n=1 Tax=Bellilinea caldifistulae TaxID=360411 RepID=A0A0P6XRD9_9CHLR|nr:class I SAM-dependent methyltransferase [Bellilinea caldifistulae]KPL74945.1 23S rRNA methyltransferase [Bellilinea caldifistulae]GAP10578.1 predicted SAM-dependent methyltransferases [Bellilinea caldifistulae]